MVRKVWCAVVAALAVLGGARGQCAEGSLFCTRGAAAGKGVFSTGTQPRMQYLIERGGSEDGYCGECSVQTTMVKYGVWFPQEYVRQSSTGSPTGAVLVENEAYPTFFRKNRVRGEQFKGRGYQAYVAWLKQHLVKGLNCIMVCDYGGNTYSDYGHIIPVTGITTRTPTSGYDADDTLTVITLFNKSPVQRRVGSYRCKRGNKPGVERGGCVPSNKSLKGWAWCLKGPAYLGIGPPVELVLDSAKEPGVGRSVTTKATVVLHGLTPGRRYHVYRFSSASQVPANSSSKPAGTPWKTFQASGGTHEIPTSFKSRTPRWFIAAEA